MNIVVDISSSGCVQAFPSKQFDLVIGMEGDLFANDAVVLFLKGDGGVLEATIGATCCILVLIFETVLIDGLRLSRTEVDISTTQK